MRADCFVITEADFLSFSGVVGSRRQNVLEASQPWNLEQVCPDHVVTSCFVPDVIIEHRGPHVAVAVPGVTICGSLGYQPLFDVKEELLHAADHQLLEVAVGGLLVQGVSVEVSSKNNEVSVAVVDPGDQLLHLVFSVVSVGVVWTHGTGVSHKHVNNK